MLGMFKKKEQINKDNSGAMPFTTLNVIPVVERRVSNYEPRKETSDQNIEEKNRKRREMYRPAGTERLIFDQQGHRLALRTELNFESPNLLHPPILTMVFWGTKEVAFIRAEVEGEAVQIVNCKTDVNFEEKAISSELLQEVERVAREKGIRKVCHSKQSGSTDWGSYIYTELGYSRHGDTMIKVLN